MARRQLILEVTQRCGVMSLRDIASMVDASTATVRRDLRDMEAGGLLRRTHGGAVPAGPSLTAEDAAPHRRNVVAAAARTVRDGDVVGVGSGRFAVLLATALADKDVTIVTNSAHVCVSVRSPQKASVLMVGGLLRESSGVVVGPLVAESLAGLRLTVAFLTGDGMDAARGLTNNGMLEAEADRYLGLAAERVTVLADPSTVGSTAAWQTVPTDAIRAVITAECPQRLVDEMSARGVSVTDA